MMHYHMTHYEQNKWTAPRKSKEELRGEVQQALQAIEDGVAALVTGDDWKRSLQFAAKFHTYSFGNMMLIQLQNPDATRVAGFNTWKKVGRWVKAGEHGIRILAPMYKVKTVEDEDGDEKKTRVTFFRLVSVFDISQTDGELVPSVVEYLGGKTEATTWSFKQIAKWLKKHGVTVEHDANLGMTGGYWEPTKQRVVLNTTRSQAHQTKTLIHELAHMLLHTPAEYRKIEMQHRLGKEERAREVKEVEAESAAFVVLSALGVPTGQYSFGYVAGWSGGKVDVVRATSTRVQTVAKFILGDVLGAADPLDEARGGQAGEAKGPKRNPAGMPVLRGWNGVDEIGYAVETGYWDVIAD